MHLIVAVVRRPAKYRIRHRKRSISAILGAVAAAVILTFLAAFFITAFDWMFRVYTAYWQRAELCSVLE